MKTGIARALPACAPVIALVLFGALVVFGAQALTPSDAGSIEQAYAASNATVKSALTKKLNSIEAGAPEGEFYFDGVHSKFKDLDGDGKVELLVHYGSGAYGRAVNEVYKYKSGKVKRVLRGDDRGLAFLKYYPKTKTLVLQKGYKAMSFTYWYKYVNGKYRQQAAKFDATQYTGGLSYEGKAGKAISKSAFAKRIAKLKKGKAKSLKRCWAW